MKKTYSYDDCYKILGIKPYCNWKELRRAYKTSIQKWHPDRFNNASDEKTIAENKIKIINIAYSQISQYYRENKKLPPVTDKPISDQLSTTGDKPNTVKAKPKPYLNKKRPAQQRPIKSSKKPIFSGLILFSTLGILYAIFQTGPNTETRHSNSSFTKTLDTYIYEAPQQAHKKNQQATLINTRYFTIGSSIGDVISIQGAPTGTDGEIWFYGNSEVHFNNGKVTHWVRSNSNPLKVRLKSLHKN